MDNTIHSMIGIDDQYDIHLEMQYRWDEMEGSLSAAEKRISELDKENKALRQKRSPRGNTALWI